MEIVYYWVFLLQRVEREKELRVEMVYYWVFLLQRVEREKEQSGRTLFLLYSFAFLLALHFCLSLSFLLALPPHEKQYFFQQHGGCICPQIKFGIKKIPLVICLDGKTLVSEIGEQTRTMGYQN